MLFKTASTIIITLLVGILVGMLLHDSGKVTAQGPPQAGPPASTQPLTSVTHDTTLSGNGTAASPLRVANGGITAPLFLTPAPPTTGQVLGFDGTGLSWQSPPSGGMKLEDHHQELEFVKAPTDQLTFSVPVADRIVQVVASVSGVEIDGQARGPNFLFGTFMLDSATGKTFGSFGLGTGSTGSYGITEIRGPNGELGHLVVEDNPGQPGDITSTQVTWRLSMWY